MNDIEIHERVRNNSLQYLVIHRDFNKPYNEQISITPSQNIKDKPHEVIQLALATILTHLQHSYRLANQKDSNWTKKDYNKLVKALVDDLTRTNFLNPNK
jgi:hypothetical protein